LIISALAIRGVAMQALPISIVSSMIVVSILFAFLLDLIQVPTFRRFQIV
jgi:hypothetical protein